MKIAHKLGERQGQRLNWTESGQTQRVLKEVTFIVLKTRDRWNRTKKQRVGNWKSTPSETRKITHLSSQGNLGDIDGFFLRREGGTRHACVELCGPWTWPPGNDLGDIRVACSWLPYSTYLNLDFHLFHDKTNTAGKSARIQHHYRLKKKQGSSFWDSVYSTSTTTNL